MSYTFKPKRQFRFKLTNKLRISLTIFLSCLFIISGYLIAINTFSLFQHEYFNETTEDGVNIRVVGDLGVIPDGTHLSITKVSNEDKNNISNSIDQVKEVKNNVVESYSYDIKILNENDEEVEPLNDVQLIFSYNKIRNNNLDTNVYHTKSIDNELKTEELPGTIIDNTITTETDSFSYYTVEFTYDNLTYSIPGDSETKLSEVLENIGLSGNVSGVTGSNDQLFSFENRDGEWYVISHQAFNTNEWMKVTIDGVDYDIVVTDAAEPELINVIAVLRTSSGSTVSTTGGTVTNGTRSGGSVYGDIYYVQATPKSGYEFLGWATSATGTSYVSTQTSVDTCAQYYPKYGLGMDSGTLYGIFKQTATTSYTITASAVTRTQSGSTVSTTGGTVSGGGSYTSGSTATLTASAKSGYTFKGWATSTTATTYLSTSTTYSPTVSSSTTYYAIFEQNAPAHVHDGVTFTAWTDSTTLPKSGNYYLATDVVLSSNTLMTGNANICLNGHTISHNITYSYAFISDTGLLCPRNYTVNIYDCQNSGKFIGNNDNDSCFDLAGSGTLNFYGGTLENFAYAVQTRFSSSNTVFNMYGGVIKGCSSAIYSYGQNNDVQPTVNIMGGEICYNGISEENAFSPVFAIYSKFHVSGGYFHHNVSYVGVINTTSCDFYVSGSPRVIDNYNYQAIITKTGNTYSVTGGTTLNIGLDSSEILTIEGNLSSSAIMGIYYGGSGNKVFTSGLSGKGNLSNFSSDRSYFGLRLTSDNEAELYVVTPSYTITPRAVTRTSSGSSISTTGGTVSGGGSYESGSSATLVATPNSGYRFRGWATSTTATTYLSSSTTYTPTVSSDKTYYAIFEDTSTTITYNANNRGSFSGNSTNSVTYVLSDSTDTRYSHTSNISDAGVQSGDYANNLDTNEVVTIPGATSLHVTITYATESTTYDWACVWAGNYPSYTASSNYSSSISGKLGDTTKTTVEYDITGNSVTFGFKSDNSVTNYGYYAVVTGGSSEWVVSSGTYKEPTSSNYIFAGWNTQANGNGTSYSDHDDVKDDLDNLGSTTLYAQWVASNVNLTINEEVRGNMADVNKNFAFTLNLTSGGTGINDTIAYTGTRSGNLTFVNGNATFNLKHGENIIFNLPAGYAYTITQNSDGYTLSKTNDSGTLSTNTTSVFTDTLSSTTPTGMIFNFIPYIVLLVVSIFGIVWIKYYKKI